MNIDRVSSISEDAFTENYLASNKPVIVTDALSDWSALSLWNEQYLIEHFGDEEFQVYDDYFNFEGITSLAEYMTEYFHCNNVTKVMPYIRGYCKFKKVDFLWADSFFAKIRQDWHLPYFLPKNNYLLPYSKNTITHEDPYPAKGIFISAKGCKTRLHKDPWCSDALLCQVLGEKKIIFYAPDQEVYLTQKNQVVHLDDIDHTQYPNFNKATPAYNDILAPGETLYIPHGWYHHVETLSNSISLTWNFVHHASGIDYMRYALQAPEDEMEVLQYFYHS